MVQPDKRKVNPKKVGSFTGLIILVVVAIVAITTLGVMVPVGHTGVVVSMGKVADSVLPEGFHIKTPWQNVIFIDNRAQKETLVTQAFSSDIQQVEVICSLNYSIDRETSQRLYKTVGVGYYDTVMLPRIMENVKATFSKYSAENLVSAREVLSHEIKTALITDLKPYGIEVNSIAIENIDFTDAFTDAVETKQVAEQTKLKTEIEQQEMLMVEKTTAERKVITANAEAEVSKINADAKAYAQTTQAEAEAESNKMVAESITKELIDYVNVNRWDGALPKLMSGDSEMRPIISLTEDGDAATGGDTP